MSNLKHTPREVFERKAELAATQDKECKINDHTFDCGCSDFISGALWAFDELKQQNEQMLDCFIELYKFRQDHCILTYPDWMQTKIKSIIESATGLKIEEVIK